MRAAKCACVVVDAGLELGYGGLEIEGSMDFFSGEIDGKGSGAGAGRRTFAALEMEVREMAGWGLLEVSASLLLVVVELVVEAEDAVMMLSWAGETGRSGGGSEWPEGDVLGLGEWCTGMTPRASSCSRGKRIKLMNTAWGKRLTPAAIVVAECCKGLVKRVEESVFVVALWMSIGEHTCVDQAVVDSAAYYIYDSRRCLPDTTSTMLLRTLHSRILRSSDALKIRNGGLNPLSPLRSIDLHLHSVVDTINSDIWRRSILAREAQYSLLHHSVLKVHLPRIEQPKHRLSLVSIVLTATPAHHICAIKEELEIVQCLGWMRRRDAVIKPKLR